MYVFVNQNIYHISIRHFYTQDNVKLLQVAITTLLTARLQDKLPYTCVCT